jgi:hypothetical protein
MQESVCLYASTSRLNLIGTRSAWMMLPRRLPPRLAGSGAMMMSRHIILPSDSARAHRAHAHTVQSNAGEPRRLYLCIVARNVPTLQCWCKHSTKRSPLSALQRWHKCRVLGARLSDTNHSNLVRALPYQPSQAGPLYYTAMLG